MRRSHLLLFTLTIATSAAICLPAVDALAPHPIVGYARTAGGGDGVEGASVYVVNMDTGENLTTTTMEGGYFQFDVGSPWPGWENGAQVTVTVEKTGEPYNKWQGNDTLTIDLGTAYQWMNITLHPPAEQPPSIVITAPAPDTTIHGTYTITGTANDPDGAVSHVDIRIDNETWHPATGTTHWTYPLDTTTLTNGSYTIYARASDGTATTTTAVNVTVDNRRVPRSPTCFLGVSALTGRVPLTVSFTLNASDPDGGITAWQLDVDGDGIPERSGIGHPPVGEQYVYTAPASYTANFTVTDDDGLTASDEVTVTVSPALQSPVADFTYAPLYPTDAAPVVFTDASVDADGSIEAREWQFGDGNSSAEEAPSHVYADNGTYTVTLTVTDDDGLSSTKTRRLTVTNVPPTAAFTCAVANGKASFADGSRDSDGAIIAWNWTFGDGDTSTEQSPVHEYADDGTYTVTLHVADDDGATSSYTLQLVVTSPDDTADHTPGLSIVICIAACLLAVAAYTRRHRR